jgi:hypothetical protein
MLFGCALPWARKEYLVYIVSEKGIHREMALSFFRPWKHLWLDSVRVEVNLETSKKHEVLFIEEAYFEYNGKKFILLQNITAKIPAMYKMDNGYYNQEESEREDGLFIVGGKVNGFARAFKDINIGDELIITITQKYSFDSGPLQIESYPYSIKCIDRRDLILYF